MIPSDMATIETAGQARDAAIEWQHWFATVPMSWGEIAEWGSAFEELAERFPEVADEFRENGII